MDDRVKMFEFDVRVGGGELPTDSCGAIIAPVGPVGGDLLENGAVRDATIQALTTKVTQFNLGHVEPTAVLGRVLQFQAVENAPRFGGRENFVKRNRSALVCQGWPARADAFH